MNVFDVVRENVTARQGAEYYGIRINRDGMACCPFHDNRHPINGVPLFLRASFDNHPFLVHHYQMVILFQSQGTFF